VGKQLDMLEAEIHGAGFGDEELDVDPDQNDDDVADSDAQAVDEAIYEPELSVRLDVLPSDQANIGCISIAKVSIC
jgi:hypothetical protein